MYTLCRLKFSSHVSVSLKSPFILENANIHAVEATLGTWQYPIVREGSMTKVTFSSLKYCTS